MKYVITKEGETTSTVLTLTEGARTVTFEPTRYTLGEWTPPPAPQYSATSFMLGAICAIILAVVAGLTS